MKAAFEELVSFLVRTAPWWGTFLAALVLSLVLVPLVREFNRRLGMVDQPSARRINKTPVPRGGGLAIYLTLMAVSFAFPYMFGRPFVPGQDPVMAMHLSLPPLMLVVLGYVDDKFGLPPLVKLAGQIVAATVAVLWCDLGFQRIIPFIPGWLDAAFTIFWPSASLSAFPP